MDRYAEGRKIVKAYLQEWEVHADKVEDFHQGRRDVVAALRKHGFTYEEIGDWIGISRQRAQQLGTS